MDYKVFECMGMQKRSCVFSELFVHEHLAGNRGEGGNDAIVF